MRNVLKKSYLIILASIVIISATLVVSSAHSSETLVISGFVSEKELPDRQNYFATLKKSYDPEISWQTTDTINTSNQPIVNGKSGIVVELDSGKVVFEKNAHEKRKIASITKVMTAIIALEHADLDQKVVISKNAASIGENSMGLLEGEEYTLEELLYGLILNSGNDAAYAISEAVAGDTETFVYWMNLKAKELGLENTYFADPSGLDNDTYSTAYELVKLTRYALKDPDFREIAKTLEKTLEEPGKHATKQLYNQTNLLNTYPGVLGLKTGYTGAAGLCLVSYAENDGVELVGVVLGSNDRRSDMILMLDHGFSTLGVDIEHNLL